MEGKEDRVSGGWEVLADTSGQRGWAVVWRVSTLKPWLFAPAFGIYSYFPSPDKLTMATIIGPLREEKCKVLFCVCMCVGGCLEESGVRP